MKVNLYSGYSTLFVAASVGKEPVIRYYPTDSNMQQLMCSLFEGMNIDYGRNYPLEFHTLENGVNFACSVHNGPTPFTSQLQQVNAPVTNAMVLQAGTMEHFFGLKSIGLFPMIETEIDDIQLAYEKSDKILSVWIDSEYNAYRDGYSNDFDPGKNVRIDELTSEQITPLDNYYLIAARDLVHGGYRPEVVDRFSDELKATTMPKDTTLDISMGYEVYSCAYVPLLDDRTKDLALQYYKEGVPEKYEWLSSVQPLDFLSLWALELGKAYTLKLYCPVGRGTSFGDELEFTVHHDSEYDSRYITSLSPTGEEIRLEDQAVPEWVHSYAAVIGEGAAELSNKGFPQRDMLNLKRSLTL